MLETIHGNKYTPTQDQQNFSYTGIITTKNKRFTTKPKVMKNSDDLLF